MSEIADQPFAESRAPSGQKKARWMAAGGILGALGATACCVLPLVLFALGIGGAWIGQLVALAPYQPFFIAATVGFLGYGYWLVYRKADCADGEACAAPVSSLIVQTGLWSATILVGLAIAWPYIVPLILG